MAFAFAYLALLFLSLPFTLAAENEKSGSGRAERYWDCCKPDCAWKGKADFDHPVFTCDKDNKALTDTNAGSSCGGGPSHLCADQSPWAINDTFSYGFAGLYLMEHPSDTWCCACYEITFTSGAVKGKKMVVQAHNSGFDVLTTNKFALAIPGGNTSYAGTCAKQFGVSNSTFGKEDEGVGSKEECDNLPEPMREGCKWRFDWFKNESRPLLDYKRVSCPKALTDRSGCTRKDEKDFTPEPQDKGTASSMMGSSYIYVTLLFVPLVAGMLNYASR